MDRTAVSPLINEIHDLARRLNDATWAAESLNHTRTSFRTVTTHTGRVILVPVFDSHTDLIPRSPEPHLIPQEAQ
jgi:hypothetical protein